MTARSEGPLQAFADLVCWLLIVPADKAALGYRRTREAVRWVADRVDSHHAGRLGGGDDA